MPAPHLLLLSAPLLGAAFMVACADPPPIAPPRPPAASTQLGVTAYGLGGLRRATPQAPCREGNSRQFDLWVGDWIVPNPAGGEPNATNRITIGLDGCAVLEHWAPRPSPQNPAAPRGRSLNAYDAETGHWHQTWVTEGGVPFRMTGALRPDGVMALEGTRLFWANGEPFIDRYTWTKVDDDHVVQAWTFDRPRQGVHQQGSIPYVRTADLPVIESPGTSASCQAGGFAAEIRALDFTVGHWIVRTDHGLELGESDIRIDPTLGGCLLEEAFTTRKGYRAIGWVYYDPIENLYYRTYVDSEGEWAELRGAPVATPLVLEGGEPVAGAPDARVRMTWTTLDAGRLRQTWEVSADAGATWRESQVLIFESR